MLDFYNRMNFTLQSLRYVKLLNYCWPLKPANISVLFSWIFFLKFLWEGNVHLPIMHSPVICLDKQLDLLLAFWRFLKSFFMENLQKIWFWLPFVYKQLDVLQQLLIKEALYSIAEQGSNSTFRLYCFTILFTFSIDSQTSWFEDSWVLNIILRFSLFLNACLASSRVQAFTHSFR